MADITKIVFTTKEAYEQKVSSNTLEEGVVYTIDAAQAVDKKEVKIAVNDGFDKIGLSLGIKKEVADFYNVDTSLKNILKELVYEKISVNFQDNSTFKISNTGTLSLKTGLLTEKNCYINVIQNEKDLGLANYEIIEKDNNKIAKITLPNEVNLTEKFELKISDFYGVKKTTMTVEASFEPIAIAKLDELIGYINFNEQASSDNKPYYFSQGTVLNGLIGILNTLEEIKEYVPSHSTVHTVIIPESITLTEEIIDSILISNSTYDDQYNTLFINKTFSSYLDLGTNTWKAFPESVSEKTTKLNNHFSSFTNL